MLIPKLLALRSIADVHDRRTAVRGHEHPRYGVTALARMAEAENRCLMPVNVLPSTRLDTWIKSQPKLTHPVPKAIRPLVGFGLTRSETSKRPATHKVSALRTWRLATITLDELIDPTASSEERKVRKRKLAEGPRIIRNTRKDRPGK